MPRQTPIPAVPAVIPSPLVAIVDDDRAVVSSLEFALGAEGIRVAAYYDAASYLERGQSVPGGGAADCIVVDYRLPGMNGIELLKELRRQGSQPPYVLVASTPGLICRTWAAAAGVPLVEKPFLDDALTDQIRAALIQGALNQGALSR